MKTVGLYLCLSMFICGCGPKAPPKRQPYFGETKSMYEVLRAVNENNRKLPTLWANHDVKATIIDKSKNNKRHDVEMSGVLLYRSPRDFRMTGSHPLAGDVLNLGSNNDVYWLEAIQGAETCWWGHYANLGKPCSEAIPIRPDLLVQVLGISEIQEDFNALPAPVMRFNNDEDAYMVVWSAHLPDRWWAVKEVWYDRRTLQPRLVDIFDSNGRIVLSAYLTDHKKVPLPDLPENQWPSIATQYRILFPDTGSKLAMKLSDLALSQKGAPNDRTFSFNPDRRRQKDIQVIQLDRNCTP